MLDMFDYMTLRPAIEPVFHDHMDIANTIIKAIQTYHDAEDYVPKVSQSYSMVNLESTVIFQIDSQKLTINGYDAGYDVSLVATRFDITEERPLIDYKINNGVIFTIDSASMDVNYNAVHYDIELIANGMTIGRKHLREYMIKVTAACNMPYKEPILVSGHALLTRDVCDVIPFIEKGMFDKMVCDILGNVAWRIQQYCVLDPDSLMMEPELLWRPMEENKNGENKET